LIKKQKHAGNLRLKTPSASWALVAHACNFSYSRGRDQEDHSSKTARQIVCETLSQKKEKKPKNPQKRAGGVA
jgi:hypothetical protein